MAKNQKTEVKKAKKTEEKKWIIQALCAILGIVTPFVIASITYSTAIILNAGVSKSVMILLSPQIVFVLGVWLYVVIEVSLKVGTTIYKKLKK